VVSKFTKHDYGSTSSGKSDAIDLQQAEEALDVYGKVICEGSDG
jgi:hypothetical protein